MTLLSLLFLAATVQAAAEPHSSSFRCSGPPGRLLLVDIDGANKTLKADIRFVSANSDGKWAPTANLVFVLEKPTYAGVKTYVDPNDPSHLIVALLRPDDLPSQPFAKVPINSSASVSATLDQGTL